MKALPLKPRVVGMLCAADDMRVSPLYKHIFPPAAAPRLAFIGLVYKSLRNLQFELQARARLAPAVLRGQGSGMACLWVMLCPGRCACSEACKEV